MDEILEMRCTGRFLQDDLSTSASLRISHNAPDFATIAHHSLIQQMNRPEKRDTTAEL